MLLINYQNSAFAGLLCIQNKMHGVRVKIKISVFVLLKYGPMDISRFSVGTVRTQGSNSCPSLRSVSCINP
jgi:hypothetical protein